jgi:RHS repeat-associated protein
MSVLLPLSAKAGVLLSPPVMNSGNSTISSQAYTYDDTSNVLTHTQAGVTTTYGYDDIDQLISESRTGYSASYTYDANGNRLTRTVNSVTEHYYYDDADKLDEIKVGGSTVKDFSYDAAGRTTSVTTGAGTTTLAYYYESRITTLTYPNASTNTFTYNGLDTRVGKADSGGTKTYKRDGVGVTAPVLSDGAASYTPGLSERRSGTSTFSHAGKNQHEQTAANESTAATQTYDAFGNLVSSSGTWKGLFGYGGSFGYQNDGDTGLKLLGHRYYDSNTGRFLTRDPAKDGRNWYVYCDNNPISRADPPGLGWHNPGQVEVHYGFKGKVYVIGEPGPGKQQVFTQLLRGHYTHPCMDVDIVIIDYPNGRRKTYFLMGWGYLLPEPCWGEQYFIDRNGKLTGPNVWGIEVWPVSLKDWQKDIDNAKKRPFPKDRRPLDRGCYDKGWWE